MLSALNILLALGAAGVFLSLPSPGPAGRRRRIAALIVGLAVLAALAAHLARWIGPDFEGRTFFVIFACLAVFAAVRVVSHPRPVYSALYFVVVVLSVAALCVLASAEFLGFALVIVYAGAIMVTYVFVIMLAQQAGIASYDTHAREPFAAVALGFVLVFASAHAMENAPSMWTHGGDPRATFRLAALQPDEAVAPLPGSAAGDADLNSLTLNEKVGNVRAVGASLMTAYVVAVEVAGVLLLVAMVGAIAIARKRIEPESLTPEERRDSDARVGDVHRLGREAPPF